MTKTIAVLGATGRVGHVLVEQLLAAGVSVRAVGRSIDKLSVLASRGADPRAGSFSDPKFLAESLRRVDGAFIVLPTEVGTPDPAGLAKSFIDAIGAGVQVARVQRVVTVSSIGADRGQGNGPIAKLHDLERRINAIPGIHAVHLRAGYFFENWMANIGLIKGAGINGGGLAADNPITMVASRDIAVTASGLLANPTFTGQKTRELQGPRNYTPREVSSIIGSAIGKPDLAYVQFPDNDVRNALLGAGFSEAMADSFLEMYRSFNEGSSKALEPRSASTTTPTSFEEFARTVFAPAFGH